MKPCEVSCPKCGCGDINQKYYAEGGKIPKSIGLLRVDFATATRELLYTTCKNCQYQWEVECLTETKN